MNDPERGQSDFCTDEPDSAVITVRVTLWSSRAEAIGVADGAWRIRVSAPPVDGAANDALRRFVAQALKRPRSSLTIMSGTRSRTKRIRVADADFRDLLARIQALS